MMEKLVFTPTEEDLRHAYGLHIQQARWRRFFIILVFAFAVGLVIAAVNGFDGMSPAMVTIVAVTIWGGICGIILQLSLKRFHIPRLARKIYGQQKDLRLENESWWNDEDIYSKNSQGQSRLQFADLVKWRANDQTILLYRSDHMFNFLPIRIFENPSLLDGLIRRLNDAGIPGERSK